MGEEKEMRDRQEKGRGREREGKGRRCAWEGETAGKVKAKV
jgi:hypothetical protein